MTFSDILSTEAMCGVVMVASLVMVVRSLLFFSRQSAQITPALIKVDAEIAKLRNGMGERKANVAKLTDAVGPLRERETRLREYADRLQEVELEYERSIAKEEVTAEEESAKRIKRRKAGLT